MAIGAPELHRLTRHSSLEELGGHCGLYLDIGQKHGGWTWNEWNEQDEMHEDYARRHLYTGRL